MENIHIKAVDFSLEGNNDNQLASDYVVKRPDAKIYHMPGWCQVITKSFGHRCYYFLALDNDNVVGVLPLVRQKSRLFGDGFSSLPYLNYGGPLADNDEIEAALLNHANNIATDVGVSSVEYRETKLRQGYRQKENKISMLLTLPTEEELWKSIGAKRRAQVKRPIRLGIEAFKGKAELLDKFYAVLSENMRDLGTPFYSKHFFRNIIEVFNDYVLLHVIEIDNKPVGAALVFKFNHVADIPWASTLRSHNRFGTNMFMYWEVLKDAIASGVKVFDFGRSSKDSGTYRFKKQWGASAKQLYWNYWLEKGSELPAVNTDNPKYRLAISVWKKMPLCLTNRLGPMIARNLP